MVSQLSASYIKQALQKGYSEEQIRRSLRVQGIKEEEINLAFQAVREKGEQEEKGEKEGLTKDFLASNVAQSIPSAKPATGPNWQGGASQEPSSVETQKRMQYSSASGPKSKLWLFISIVLLVLVGVGSAFVYFNYSEEIIGFFVSEPEPEVTPILPVPSVCAKDTKVCPDGSTVSRIQPDCNFAECPEVVFTSENEIRIGNMGKLRLEVEDYFQKNGVYPQTVVNNDADGFYCYRKNGGHYVLGTVLSEPLGSLDQVSLDTDLDGNYYCDDIVKNCSDPVYCIDNSI